MLKKELQTIPVQKITVEKNAKNLHGIIVTLSIFN